MPPRLDEPREQEDDTDVDNSEPESGFSFFECVALIVHNQSNFSKTMK